MGKAKTPWTNSVPDFIRPASGVSFGMASAVDHIVSHFSVTKSEKTSSKYCLKDTYLLLESKVGV